VGGYSGRMRSVRAVGGWLNWPVGGAADELKGRTAHGQKKRLIHQLNVLFLLNSLNKRKFFHQLNGWVMKRSSIQRHISSVPAIVQL